jgi:hypothetical protein
MLKKHSQKLRFSRFVVVFFSILLLFFIGIRLVNLPDVINFGADAGRDFLVVWNIYTTKHLALIGPPSEYTINGREFFFGPAPYYIILPALLIGNWDPIFVSYLLIVINLSVLAISLVILNKYIKEKSILYFFAIFCTFTPSFVTYAQSYWNPHFMLPTATLLLSLLAIVRYQSSRALLLFLLIGFLFGLGLQFHYSFILAILIGLVWIIVNKRLSIFNGSALLGGFIVGFSPIILFELRNGFYNLNTLFLVFTHNTNSQHNFVWQQFYGISVAPFIFLLLSLILTKIKNIHFLSAYILIGIYMLWSLQAIITAPRQELSYPTLKNMVTLIKNDNPSDFNIVDQLTKDNRAMALRYMLTTQGIIPMEVTEYPKAKTIYIYSKSPLNTLLIKPVWEIKSFVPFTKVTEQEVSKDIFIYKAEK